MNLDHTQTTPISYYDQPQPASWIELDRASFIHNINQLHHLVGPNVQLSIVVKANAYGHGLLEIGQLCQENQQVQWLCTFSLREAILLRHHGVTKPILVLGALDADLQQAAFYDIDCTVYDLHVAQQLHKAAQACGKKIAVHIKIDSGLGRLGLLGATVLDDIAFIARLSGLYVRGIFSHFAESDLADATFTALQFERFQEILTACEQRGLHFLYRHIANTSATIRFSAMHLNFVRIGGAAYGFLKPYVAQIKDPAFALQPMLWWKSRLMHIKHVPAGTPISYARTFVTQRPTLVGIIPVGYCDGFDRRFSNNGVMYIHGQAVPIIGRVCMNMTLFDLTDVQHDIAVGDEVTILGPLPGCSIEETADKLNTIHYEMLAHIGSYVPRIIK